MWLINNTHTHTHTHTYTRTHTHNDPTVSLAFTQGEKDVPEISGLESGAVLDGEYSGFSHSVE